MRSSKFGRVAPVAAMVAVLWAVAPVRAQQTATIRGTVTDSVDGGPVSGAQVFVAGTRLGVLTDDAGRYVIPGAPTGEVTIRVQHIAYAPEERRVSVAAGGSAVVDFGVTPSAVALDELVVVGYGTRARRELSSAVTSVEGETVAAVPIAGLDGALQGRAPGVFVVQNAGNPGNGITVRIRGSSSISGSNQPLYVVDGVPILRDDFSQLGLGGQDITAVTGINPDEIESIDILKDAASASIYGSRASNGVVLITTKRGRFDTPSTVTFSMSTGWQDVPKKIDLLSAREYVDFFAEAAANDGYAPPFTEADILADTDWQDEIFRVAPVRDISVGLSGGSDRVRYYASGSFFDQEGVAIGSAYDRASARVNLDFDASERLSLSTSIGLVRERHDRIENDNTIHGVVTNALANPPIIPVRNDGGSFTSTADGLAYTNSVALANLIDIEARTIRALGNVEATLDLGSGLSWHSRVGMDVLNLRDFRYDSPEIIGTYAASAGGISRQGNTTADRYLVESYLAYERPTATIGQLSVTGGSSLELNTEEWDFLRGEGFPSPQFTYAGNAGTITDFDAGKDEYNLVSFFTRANYNLLSRYFFTASVRADGSSRFGHDNRYGFFSSASVGWAISDEAFMDWLRPIGDLRLRASYGETGNQDINDDYASLGRYGRANYSGEPGIALTDLANPDLKWETTREMNVGLDFDVFEGRLGLNADYYVKRTHDLLFERPITTTSGLEEFWENVGSVENRGVEVSLSSVNLQPSSPDGLSWTTDFQVSLNRNEVLELYNGEPFAEDLNWYAEGEEFGAFYTHRFDGVDTETGDAIFYDANDDGAITQEDRVIVGSPHPDYWGGMGNTLAWKDLELSTFVQFSVGAEVYNSMRLFADDGGYYFDNKFADVLDRWQEPGDVTMVPRASYDGISGARRESSRFIEDGSYLRIQEVTLSYRLPQAFSRMLRMSDATLYGSIRNLHTFTEYTGFDPELNYAGSGSNLVAGTDFYSVPIPRTFTIGIDGTW